MCLLQASDRSSKYTDHKLSPLQRTLHWLPSISWPDVFFDLEALMSGDHFEKSEAQFNLRWKLYCCGKDVFVGANLLRFCSRNCLVTGL